jgi:general stress protein 26
MDKQEAMTEGLQLIERSNICLLGTNSENGFPNIKAMMNAKHEGIHRIWLSTNASSRRVQQLKNDNRACVYYVDDKDFKGLMLIGTIQIVQDLKSRQMLWADGDERYYPLGVEDPDYSVLCFTAHKGNYYHKLKNITFEIE